MTDSGNSLPAERMLADAFAELLTHIPPVSAILLRPFPLQQPLHAQGDLDLLTDPATARLMVRQARQLAMDQRCITRIRSASPRKMVLTLHDVDAVRRIDIDLWMEFDQIVRPRRTVTSRDLLNHFRADVVSDACFPGIGRLPPDVESALYCHHLSAKRRNPRLDGGLARFDELRQRLEAHPQPDRSLQLANQLLAQLSPSTSVTDDAIRLANQILVLRMKGIRRRPYPARLRERVRRMASWLRGDHHRRPCVFAVTGCDGVGKSTLIGAVVEQARRPGDGRCRIRCLTTKRLYRRSPVYRITAAILRRIFRTSRERLDQRFAVLAWLRAVVQFRLLMGIAGKRLTVLDRCLEDLLIADRKTDIPRVVTGAGAVAWLGPRMPVIQLHTTFAVANARKPEMTAAGFDRTSQLVFDQLCCRIPFDVIVMDNSRDPATSARIFDRLITQLRGALDTRPDDDVQTSDVSTGARQRRSGLSAESRAA